jgi:Sec-independent protein translocase protein TatA
MTILMIGMLVVGLPQWPAYAQDATGADLRQIKRQIQTIKSDEERERLLDEKLIEQLDRKVEHLENQNERLERSNQTLQSSSQKLQTETSAEFAQLQQRWSGDAPPSEFAQEFHDYLGEHQLTIVGDAAVSFIYDRQSGKNTFNLEFQPILLYRLNDWLMFEGSIAANLPVGSNADFELPVATAHIFLNKYLEINAGIFDQPFGDFYEDQSAVWVNRFITAPLPYGAEALVPPTDVGVQLRGGLQWGALGQDFDYTAWVANGPGFDPSLPQQVVGEVINPVNNVGINTNGRALGARLRVYPLPIDSNLGRLELGGSTLDGKWLDGNWYNAWGIDFAYLKGSLQARGEYLEMYRQMPNANADNRQGWYVQVGYFLNGLPLPAGLSPVEDVARRLELLVRYSGVNQRAVVADEISTVPQLGVNGSPAIFTPHAREVALGLDYWISPSIVLQNEVDFELPGAGGSVINFGGNSTPTTTPQGATTNDVAFLTQLAIGF